jgi:hypothetical protein
MHTTAALAPAHSHKINIHPLQPALGKAGCTLKRALDGAAWGAGSGSIAGAMLGMAIFVWSLNTPFANFFAEIVSALIILVVVATPRAVSLLRPAARRLRWLYASPAAAGSPPVLFTGCSCCRWFSGQDYPGLPVVRLVPRSLFIFSPCRDL